MSKRVANRRAPSRNKSIAGYKNKAEARKAKAALLRGLSRQGSMGTNL